MAQIDSRRRQGRRMQLATRVAPDDDTALFLSRFGQQQCERFGESERGWQRSSCTAPPWNAPLGARSSSALNSVWKAHGGAVGFVPGIVK